MVPKRKAFSTNCLIGILSLSFFFLVLTSCDDKNLAQSLKGTWITDDITCEDDDGYSETMNITYSFQYNKKVSEYGGHFVEYRTILFSDEEDGFVISGTVHTSLKGIWTVTFGDLDLEYDISTLNVTVKDVDWYLSENADFFTRMGVMNMYDAGVSIDKNELTEVMKEKAYQIYQDLLMDGNEITYEYLNVEGNTLSFEMEDDEEGRTEVTMRRISTD